MPPPHGPTPLDAFICTLPAISCHLSKMPSVKPIGLITATHVLRPTLKRIRPRAIQGRSSECVTMVVIDGLKRVQALYVVYTEGT